jgi:hypothetical protein
VARMARRYFLVMYGPNLPNLHCLEKSAAFISITLVKAAFADPAFRNPPRLN